MADQNACDCDIFWTMWTVGLATIVEKNDQEG